jgi:hypothetical protein
MIAHRFPPLRQEVVVAHAGAFGGRQVDRHPPGHRRHRPDRRPGQLRRDRLQRPLVQPPAAALGRPGSARDPPHDEGGLRLDLFITVAFGVPVAEVARQVDSAVRYSLRHYVGAESKRRDPRRRVALPADGDRASRGDRTNRDGRTAQAGDEPGARRRTTEATRLRPRGRRRRGNASLDDNASQSMTRRGGDGAPGFWRLTEPPSRTWPPTSTRSTPSTSSPFPTATPAATCWPPSGRLWPRPRPSRSIGRPIAQAISFGALMGARGNSGVIASQIFRGMAEGSRRQASLQRPGPGPRPDPGHGHGLQGRREAGRGHDPDRHPRGGGRGGGAAENGGDLEDV